MDQRVFTPSPSTEPNSETPVSADRRCRTPNDLAAHNKQRTYEFQLQVNRERSAVKAYLLNFIKNDSKAGIVAGRDRWQTLIDKRGEKLQKRIKEGKFSTETLFPDKYNEWAEHRYHKKAFNVYLNGDGQGQDDQDDEEPEQLASGIKSECMEHDNAPNQHTARVSRSATTSYCLHTSSMENGKPRAQPDSAGAQTWAHEQEQPEEDERPYKPEVGVPCDRSHSIRFGYAGLHCAETNANKQARELEQSAMVGRVFTPGSVSQEVTSRKRKLEDEGVVVASKRSCL